MVPLCTVPSAGTYPPLFLTLRLGACSSLIPSLQHSLANEEGKKKTLLMCRFVHVGHLTHVKGDVGGLAFTGEPLSEINKT
jgi:hypothetical protein